MKLFTGLIPFWLSAHTMCHGNEIGLQMQHEREAGKFNGDDKGRLDYQH